MAFHFYYRFDFRFTVRSDPRLETNLFSVIVGLYPVWATFVPKIDSDSAISSPLFFFNPSSTPKEYVKPPFLD